MLSFLSPNQELLHQNSYTNKRFSPLPTRTKRNEKEMELLINFLHIPCIVPDISQTIPSLIPTTTILRGGMMPLTQLREKRKLTQQRLRFEPRLSACRIYAPSTVLSAQPAPLLALSPSFNWICSFTYLGSLQCSSLCWFQRQPTSLPVR